MLSNNHWKLIAFVCVVALAFSVSFLTGCSEDTKTETITETITIHDTVYVDVLVTAISVDNIVLDPAVVEVGQTIMLTASASKNPDFTVGDLEYYWYATGGEFHESVGDTVEWRAPEEEGSYVISVHAADGNYVAIGTTSVAVGAYVPTVEPYYVGDETCGNCHSAVHDEWEETAHAHAWETLQNSGHPAPYCEPCHAVGFDDITGNAGYDESPVMKFVNVQCEACHGPGSQHIANPGETGMSINYTSENCGRCHEGSHHPYWEEWSESPHNFDPHVSAHGAGVRSSCEGCHEGTAALVRMNDPLLSTAHYGSGTVIADRDTLEYPYTSVGCPVCHNSHSDEFPGQIRTMADVPLVEANGENPVITQGGVGKLCMHCHHARRAPEFQIENGYSHFGPHGNPQADMMAGKSAYHGVAAPDFPWAGPSHLNVQNSCKTCHLNMVEYVSNDEPAITGHTFEPTVEACANCHGAITSFDDIRALEDFDGDGIVEGVMSEVDGLMLLLEDALRTSLEAAGYTVGEGYDGVVEAISDVSTSDRIHREAGYNMVYLHDDKSHGIHNPDYAVQLLQQSYRYLTGTNVPNAVIHDGQMQVADVQ